LKLRIFSALNPKTKSSLKEQSHRKIYQNDKCEKKEKTEVWKRKTRAGRVEG